MFSFVQELKTNAVAFFRRFDVLHRHESGGGPTPKWMTFAASATSEVGVALTPFCGPKA